MNNQRRKQLAGAIEKLEQAVALIEETKETVEFVNEEEQEAYDNMPESLQESERGQTIQENIDKLEDVIFNIESYIDEINDSVESLRDILGD